MPALRPARAEAASLGYAVVYVVLWGAILGEMSRQGGFYLGSEGIIGGNGPCVARCSQSTSSRCLVSRGHPTQWRAFFGCYLGWMLDGFDFTILTFLLVDIERSFTVNRALAGALGTVTLMFRLAGGIGAGTAADRGAGRPADVLDPLVFRLCVFQRLLDVLPDAVRAPRAVRDRDGRGLGRRHAPRSSTGRPTCAARRRDAAERLLDRLHSVSLVFQFLYPLVTAVRHGLARDAVARRPAVIPGALDHGGVEESPVWLDRQRTSEGAEPARTLALPPLFHPDLIRDDDPRLAGDGRVSLIYHAITFSYPR